MTSYNISVFTCIGLRRDEKGNKRNIFLMTLVIDV